MYKKNRKHFTIILYSSIYPFFPSSLSLVSSTDSAALTFGSLNDWIFADPQIVYITVRSTAKPNETQNTNFH